MRLARTGSGEGGRIRAFEHLFLVKKPHSRAVGRIAVAQVAKVFRPGTLQAGSVEIDSFTITSDVADVMQLIARAVAVVEPYLRHDLEGLRALRADRFGGDVAGALPVVCVTKV
jgi:hypothetical protein